MSGTCAQHDSFCFSFRMKQANKQTGAKLPSHHQTICFLKMYKSILLLLPKCSPEEFDLWRRASYGLQCYCSLSPASLWDQIDFISLSVCMCCSVYVEYTEGICEVQMSQPSWICDGQSHLALLPGGTGLAGQLAVKAWTGSVIKE